MGRPNGQLGTLKMDGINFDKYFCSFQFFFEILMDYIFTQSDEVKPARKN